MNITSKSFGARVFADLVAILLAAWVAFSGNHLGIVVAAVFITLYSCATRSAKSGSLFLVTLSVPEIMTQVLDAFKYECPEIFGPNGFATDFSSTTAVLGDRITAKIAKIPVTGAYDRANGGFKAATQDVTTLFEDVPVTLDQFRIVTININWLTQLASKLELYQEAIRNYGYALSKYVLDACLGIATAANFSNSAGVAIGNVTLDTLDVDLRNQMNAQKMVDTGRFLICNTPFASKIGADDRVRNSQFGIDQKNGGRGYRRYNNIGGFSWIREYPDFPANGIGLNAFAGEKRGFTVASRAINFSNAAESLGITKTMDFYAIADQLSGIQMTGVAWQEQGTGDVFVSAGVLFGMSAGKQGGAAGTITDNGGLLVKNP
jgi:hypothetical protein